jgi:hypothetical protein
MPGVIKTHDHLLGTFACFRSITSGLRPWSRRAMSTQNEPCPQPTVYPLVLNSETATKRSVVAAVPILRASEVFAWYGCVTARQIASEPMPNSPPQPINTEPMFAVSFTAYVQSRWESVNRSLDGKSLYSSKSDGEYAVRS